VLPWSLRPGEARGTQKARSMAEVRAARTEEKIGHSGRDGREKQEGPGEPGPYKEKSAARKSCATGLEDLLEADVNDVAELGRARRQLGEIQEVGVKGVVAGGRRIDRTAALEDAGGIL